MLLVEAPKTYLVSNNEYVIAKLCHLIAGVLHRPRQIPDETVRSPDVDHRPAIDGEILGIAKVLFGKVDEILYESIVHIRLIEIDVRCRVYIQARSLHQTERKIIEDGPTNLVDVGRLQKDIIQGILHGPAAADAAWRCPLDGEGVDTVFNGPLDLLVDDGRGAGVIRLAQERGKGGHPAPVSILKAAVLAWTVVPEVELRYDDVFVWCCTQERLRRDLIGLGVLLA